MPRRGIGWLVDRARVKAGRMHSLAVTGKGRIGEIQSRSDDPIKAQGQETRATRALTPPWVRGQINGSHNVAALISPAQYGIGRM